VSVVCSPWLGLLLLLLAARLCTSQPAARRVCWTLQVHTCHCYYYRSGQREREREREREKLKGNKTVVILPIRFEQEEEEEERISCREREPLPTSVGPTVGQSVSDSTHLVDTFSIKKIKGRPVGGKSIPSSIHPGSCTFYKVEEFDFDFFRLVWLQPRKNVYSFVTLRLSSFVVCGSQRQTRQEMPGVSIFHLFPFVLFLFYFSVLILFGVERKRQKRTGRGDRGRQEKFAFMIISGCFGSHI
jgi:hypothetical protein